MDVPEEPAFHFAPWHSRFEVDLTSHVQTIGTLVKTSLASCGRSLLLLTHGEGVDSALSAVTQCWEASCAALQPGASRDEAEGQEQMARTASLLLSAVDMLLAEVGSRPPSTHAVRESMQWLAALLAPTRERLRALVMEAEASEHGVAGRFEWVDGPLTRSVTVAGVGRRRRPIYSRWRDGEQRP